MIGEPPVLAGDIQLIDICPSETDLTNKFIGSLGGSIKEKTLKKLKFD